MVELIGNKDALVEAVLEWVCDRSPTDPGDARLMQAIWRYRGPNIEPCPGCDGDCGEDCEPISVAAACAGLDHFIDKWMKQRGITSFVKETGNDE